MLSREEKISRIVQTRLEGMDLSALEDFYVDIKTEQFEEASDALLDAIFEEECHA